MNNKPDEKQSHQSFPALLAPDKKNMPVELLDKDAQRWAHRIGKGISTHQVRRFFDEFKKYKRLLDTKIKTYVEIRPLIYMLKSKAKYAVSKNRDVEPFAQFIEKAIEEIKKGNEAEQELRFKNFCLLFEAVYGFAELKKN